MTLAAVCRIGQEGLKKRFTQSLFHHFNMLRWNTILFLLLMMVHPSQADVNLKEVSASDILSAVAEYKGEKAVLVNYWATWCGPCIKAIPELNKFHKQFGDKLVVIGISDEKESVIASMKNPRIEYFSAIDTKKRMKNVVQVKGIPHVMIIDPQGIVRWEGFPFLSGHKLTETVVENLLRQHGAKKK